MLFRIIIITYLHCIYILDYTKCMSISYNPRYRKGVYNNIVSRSVDVRILHITFIYIFSNMILQN